MKLYNTLSRKLEEFIPHNDKMVTMYTCGPTVYHYAHIGNLRTMIHNDIMKRMFTENGFYDTLFFLVNLQDSFFIEQVNYGSLICE